MSGRFSNPLSAASIQREWPSLRQMGPARFVLRYGVLRFAPLVAGPLLGVALGQWGGDLSPARWLGLITVCLLAGAAWGGVTWRVQEQQWFKAQGPLS